MLLWLEMVNRQGDGSYFVYLSKQMKGINKYIYMMSGVSMYVCTCVCVCVGGPSRVEAQGWSCRSSFCTWPLTDPKVHHLARQVGQLTVGNVLPPAQWDYPGRPHTYQLFMWCVGSGDPNSIPNTLVATALTHWVISPTLKRGFFFWVDLCYPNIGS